MSNNYSHIMDKIMGTPWVITPESLQTILSIMDRKIAGEDIDTSEYAFGPMQGELLSTEEGPPNPVGVLNINGPILYDSVNVTVR